MTQLSMIAPNEREAYCRDLLTIINEIVGWKQETFGTPQPAAFMARAAKEVCELLLELEQGRDISEELADIIIVYAGASTLRPELTVLVRPAILFSPIGMTERTMGGRLFFHASQAYEAAIQELYHACSVSLQALVDYTLLIANRANVDILAAIKTKFAKNKARTWAINDGLAQHIAEGRDYVANE